MKRRLGFWGLALLAVLQACGNEPSTSPESSVGNLTATIGGLPPGVDAAVTVTGPGGFSRVVTATETLTDLTPGGYTVSATDVASSGHRYAPGVLTQTVQVAADATTQIQVSYAIATGGLALQVIGVPPGVPVTIDVTGPNGYQSQHTKTDTLIGLDPGSYQVVASPLVTPSEIYTASPSTVHVALLAGATPTPVPLVYALSSGALSITTSGLPTGVTAIVTVSGPGGFDQTVSLPVTLSPAVTGDYLITGDSVVDNGDVYTPSTGPVTVTVQSGATAQGTVAFVQISGTLDLTVVGLPPSTPAAVTVTGPNNFDSTITESTTFRGLVPGSYVIDAAQATDGSDIYDPSPLNQAASVTAANTANASVTYTLRGAPTLNLTVDGAYLVQSVQRYDGTVPLMEGRDAYLRVFAQANMTNSETPDVRVRLYDNGTLTQTLTLSPTAGAVPMVADESQLSNSWNALIPGSSIQQGLSMLVDVDPTNTVPEASETDNSYPLNGQPLAIDVRNLLPLGVSLVPVFQQSSGRTGNVNAGNADQFMEDAVAVFPAGTYDVDVHADYTTATPELQANNANGAWGAILSEILALRNVDDGSSKYYYGVVSVSYSSGIAGLGYVPSSPTSTSKAAIGWDYLPSGSSVMAHELGHNFGRFHAPCGNPSGVDPSYPYANASIGVYGMDVATLSVKVPGTGPNDHKDLMSYCSPQWISDYTYEAVLSFRELSPTGFVRGRIAPQRVLLVWGRINGDSVILEPSFELTARPILPERTGPYTVDALDDAGNTIFNYSFAGDEVADLPGGPEQHFSFLIPLRAGQSAPATVRVRDGGRLAVRSASVASRSAAITSLVRVTSSGSQTVEVQWDVQQNPMVLVRDPATGDILSFARGGFARIRTDLPELDVLVSDGAASRGTRLRVVGR